MLLTKRYGLYNSSETKPFANGIGKLKLKGTRNLHFYQLNQIKRVRLVKRAGGYYVQFCIDVDRCEVVETTQNTIGLDVGLKEFYTDSNGINACGEVISTDAGEILYQQIVSMNQESQRL